MPYPSVACMRVDVEDVHLGHSMERSPIRTKMLPGSFVQWSRSVSLDQSSRRKFTEAYASEAFRFNVVCLSMTTKAVDSVRKQGRRT